MWRSFTHSYSSLAAPKEGRNTQWPATNKRIKQFALLALSIAAVFSISLLYRHQQAPPLEQHEDPIPKYERPSYLPAKNDTAEERYAYVALLSKTLSTDNDKWNADDYFVAIRTLVWQLRHDPETRAAPEIDVVILVGPSVSEEHRHILRKDGAVVKEIEHVHGKHDEWIVPKTSRWADVMDKLRAWELVEYSKVIVLDGDILLAKPLDGAFTDPGAQLMTTKPGDGHKDDEPDLPDEYLLSAIIDFNPGKKHDYPPNDRGRRKGHFNAGFFLLRPDKKLFDYFVGLLSIKDRFNPGFPEQNMLNYAFRWDGAMPFKELSPMWNVNFPSEHDIKSGVASLHMKWWKVEDRPMMRFALSKRWQMEGFWLERDEL
ncbi:glycosyl transferase family 8 domain-containing protein [Sarocladium implicatum]|nr:glycosyl transferase family 8 domain-containing protein [Sarocladium implicatum]